MRFIRSTHDAEGNYRFKGKEPEWGDNHHDLEGSPSFIVHMLSSDPITFDMLVEGVRDYEFVFSLERHEEGDESVKYSSKESIALGLVRLLEVDMARVVE